MSRIRFLFPALVIAMSVLAPSASLAADPTVEVLPGPATGTTSRSAA